MRLGYLYSRYPVLSQTFCDAEMLELERRGHEIVLGSMFPPKTDLRHDYLRKLRSPIHYAPSSRKLDALVRRAKRRGRWPAPLVAEHETRFGPEFKAALRARNALFFVELFERERVPHFHVHFASHATHTALFIKAISKISFSFTAHAQDFMVDVGNQELLREMCHQAAFVVAVSDYSRALLMKKCPDAAAKIVRIYNGIDLRKFVVSARQPGNVRPRILSLGRLVEFKGFRDLIVACAELHNRGAEFECEIIGDGPLREELQKAISAAGLEEVVRLSGALPHEEVVRRVGSCDVFSLASVVDTQGASDILPTVILEAMAAARPVVSTRLAGIPEMVGDGETGLLVESGDALGLASALESLLRNAEMREQFGAAGRHCVERKFDITRTTSQLVEMFARVALPPASVPPSVGQRWRDHFALRGR